MSEKSLKSDIQAELENLERLKKEMEKVIKAILNSPDFIQTRAMGSILHDFYCGIEKILTRISIHMDGLVPEGEDWHNDLLIRMSQPVEGTRDKVISYELVKKLKEYLRFRHLFRHIYGFELEWDRFKDLTLSLNNIFQELKSQLEKFLMKI